MAEKKAFSQLLRSWFLAAVIPLSLVGGYLVYYQILGNPANFEGGDPSNEPLEANYLGVIFKGGQIVVLQIAFIIILFTYSLERLLTLYRAQGKVKNDDFARKIKVLLNGGNIGEALSACDHQKGSVANVVKNGLLAYQEVIQQPEGQKEEKQAAIQKELEEATQLELPVLNNNLIIISTLASIGTLVGLLGTVTGMIKAFSALARAGSPDAIGLANGISQALVTTALGIATAAVAIVFYNFFTNKIDRITYAIDEATFSILHTFKASYSNDLPK